MPLLLALTLSFLGGSIPFGVLIGRARGVDVRAVGSGNIGTTNVWRALGPLAGSLVFALDVLKGVAGPLIGHWLLGGSEWGVAGCGIAAVLGHTFSPFLGFRGGKGIATSLGAMLGLMPLVGLIIFAIWGVILGLTRMISAASVACCFGLPILAILMGAPWPYVAVAAAMSVVAFVKHLPNLKRIRVGTEPHIGQKKAAVVREHLPEDGFQERKNSAQQSATTADRTPK